MTRLLLDANLSPCTASFLVERFAFDAVALVSLGLAHLDDFQVIEFAKGEFAFSSRSISISANCFTTTNAAKSASSCCGLRTNQWTPLIMHLSDSFQILELARIHLNDCWSLLTKPASG